MTPSRQRFTQERGHSTKAQRGINSLEFNTSTTALLTADSITSYTWDPDMVFSSSKKAPEAEVKDPSAFVDHETSSDDGHDVYQTSEGRRQIGLVSAIFLIFNRMIGTGIFATPSSIVASCGSIGLALFIWVAGLIIAAAGMAVYLEFGTALPRNGGEKNYLEHVFKKPRFLVTGLYVCSTASLSKFT